ncbi:unnamed protein product [Pleuronectes platessa]|uniref:Uncharacterized protein n=1 Tax=Pleuronectes platessa TaxID=8262 RepID=A0A9N7UMY7_PLEPL|nr:unnamed protein product [Pleuronectes platessa]
MPQHPHPRIPLCYSKCPPALQAPELLTYNSEEAEIIKSTLCIHYHAGLFLHRSLMSGEREREGERERRMEEDERWSKDTKSVACSRASEAAVSYLTHGPYRRFQVHCAGRTRANGISESFELAWSGTA